MMNLEISREMKMLIFNILKNSKILIIKILDRAMLDKTFLKEKLFLKIMKSALSRLILKKKKEWSLMILKMIRIAFKCLIKLKFLYMKGK